MISFIKSVIKIEDGSKYIFLSRYSTKTFQTFSTLAKIEKVRWLKRAEDQRNSCPATNEANTQRFSSP